MKISIEIGNAWRSAHNDSSMTYWAAWNELIDNAIDAGADLIYFNCTPDSITIVDNGRGIDTIKGVEQALKLNDNKSSSNNNLIGHFGIGLKDATMRLGKGLLMRTRAKGCKAIEVDVPWSDNSWLEGVECNTIEDDIEYGTSITIFRADGEKLRKPSDASFIFHDKIIESKGIKIFDCDGLEYKTYGEPLFEHKKRYENVTIDGKKIDFEIGLLHKDYMDFSGFHVYNVDNLRYYNRKTKNITSKIDAKDGLYVSIGLHDVDNDWILDKNKRGIINIGIAVNYINENYFSYWKQKQDNVGKSDLLQDVQDILAEWHGLESVIVGQQVRYRGETTGTVKKVGSGRKLNEASKIRKHDSRDTRLRNDSNIAGILVIPVKWEKSPETYGNVSYDKNVKVVKLNECNDYVKELIGKSTPFKKLSLIHFIHTLLTASEIRRGELFDTQALDAIRVQHKSITDNL